MANRLSMQGNSNLKKGSRVYVDFISDSRTEFSGNRFFGEGTLDFVEDGYIFGQLDSGETFMCNASDATPISAPEDCKALNKVILFSLALAGAVLIRALGF